MESVKYRNEIDNVFTEFFREEWMDDEDYAELIESVFKFCNISYKGLSDDIQKGVDNGYSVDSQLEIIRGIFSKSKE